MLVVDPSAVLGLTLDDEPADYAERVVERVRAEAAVVPALFWYEIRNVLIVNERRGRITPQRSAHFLEALGRLPIRFASLPDEANLLSLSRSHGLSVYDAAYLDLAQRLDCPLATLDQRLKRAATSIGIDVMEK